MVQLGCIGMTPDVSGPPRADRVASPRTLRAQQRQRARARRSPVAEARVAERESVTAEARQRARQQALQAARREGLDDVTEDDIRIRETDEGVRAEVREDVVRESLRRDAAESLDVSPEDVDIRETDEGFRAEVREDVVEEQIRERAASQLGLPEGEVEVVDREVPVGAAAGFAQRIGTGVATAFGAREATANVEQAIETAEERLTERFDGEESIEIKDVQVTEEGRNILRQRAEAEAERERQQERTERTEGVFETAAEAVVAASRFVGGPTGRPGELAPERTEVDLDLPEGTREATVTRAGRAFRETDMITVLPGVGLTTTGSLEEKATASDLALREARQSIDQASVDAGVPESLARISPVFRAADITTDTAGRTAREVGVGATVAAQAINPFMVARDTTRVAETGAVALGAAGTGRALEAQAEIAKTGVGAADAAPGAARRAAGFARERPIAAGTAAAGVVAGSVAGGVMVDSGLRAARTGTRRLDPRRPTVDIADLEPRRAELISDEGVALFGADPRARATVARAEFERRARQNPEELQELFDAGVIGIRSEDSRLGRRVDVGEGQFELPGLFVAPDLSKLRLTQQGETSLSLSDLTRPRLPTGRGAGDQITAFALRDVDTLPPGTRAGFAVRGPEGEILSRFPATGGGAAQARALESAVPGAQRIPDPEASAVRAVREEGEEGVGLVRATGDRTREAEAVVPEGTLFERIGRFDVEGEGRLIPGAAFRPVGGVDVDDLAGGAARADLEDGFSGELVTGEEISRRASRRAQRGDGAPYAPLGSPTSAGAPSASSLAAATTPEAAASVISRHSSGVPRDISGSTTTRTTTTEATGSTATQTDFESAAETFSGAESGTIASETTRATSEASRGISEGVSGAGTPAHSDASAPERLSSLSEGASRSISESISRASSSISRAGSGTTSTGTGTGTGVAGTPTGLPNIPPTAPPTTPPPALLDGDSDRDDEEEVVSFDFEETQLIVDLQDPQQFVFGIGEVAEGADPTQEPDVGFVRREGLEGVDVSDDIFDADSDFGPDEGFFDDEEGFL